MCLTTVGLKFQQTIELSYVLQVATIKKNQKNVLHTVLSVLSGKPLAAMSTVMMARAALDNIILKPKLILLHN